MKNDVKKYELLTRIRTSKHKDLKRNSSNHALRNKSLNPDKRHLDSTSRPTSKHNDVADRPLTAVKKKAAVKISGSEVSEKSIGIRALFDVMAVFEAKNNSKLRTKRLLIFLCADKEKPWATFSQQGLKIGAKQLASILKPFGIHSKDIRFKKGVYKGYRKKWFTDAYRRVKALKASTNNSR